MNWGSWERCWAWRGKRTGWGMEVGGRMRLGRNVVIQILIVKTEIL